MTGILAVVVKIIGILLLVILFFLGLLLFYPVSYHIKGEGREAFFVRAHFWWLFHLVGFAVTVGDGDVRKEWRIAGILLKKRHLADDWQQETAEEEERTVPAPKRETDAAGTSGKVRRKKIKRKSSGKPKKTSASRRTSHILERLSHLKREALDERNHRAISHIWREVGYLFRHIRPRSIRAEVSFSAGDPAWTGQITGALSLLPAIYQYDAHIYPDFASEKGYISGRLELRGRMALCHIAVVLFSLLRDREVGRFLRKC